MSARVIFAVIAIVCALLALLGVPDSIEPVKLLAVGLISAGVAIVVP